VLRACIHALERWDTASSRCSGNESLRDFIQEGRKAFARGDYIETTPDELMDGIEAELGLRRQGP
jgi:hypothetical protein